MIKIKVIYTDKGYIAVSDNQIPYSPDGTQGNFLCLSELEYGLDKSLVTKVGDCPSCRQILATDESVKLEGVPQFKLEQDYVSDKHEPLYSTEDLRDAVQYWQTLDRVGKTLDELTIETINFLKTPRRLTEIEVEAEYAPVNHASGLPSTGHPLMDISIQQNYKIKITGGFLSVKKYLYGR